MPEDTVRNVIPSTLEELVNQAVEDQNNQEALTLTEMCQTTTSVVIPRLQRAGLYPSDFDGDVLSKTCDLVLSSHNHRHEEPGRRRAYSELFFPEPVSVETMFGTKVYQTGEIGVYHDKVFYTLLEKYLNGRNRWFQLINRHNSLAGYLYNLYKKYTNPKKGIKKVIVSLRKDETFQWVLEEKRRGFKLRVTFDQFGINAFPDRKSKERFFNVIRKINNVLNSATERTNFPSFPLSTDIDAVELLEEIAELKPQRLVRAIAILFSYKPIYVSGIHKTLNRLFIHNNLPRPLWGEDAIKFNDFVEALRESGQWDGDFKTFTDQAHKVLMENKYYAYNVNNVGPRVTAVSGYALDKESYNFEVHPEAFLFEKLHFGKYIIYLLDKCEPRAAFLGLESDCCQSICNGAGGDITRHALRQSSYGFLVIEDENKKLLAQSMVWEHDDGGFVIDSIETKHGKKKKKRFIASIYKEHIIPALKKSYDKVYVGAGAGIKIEPNYMKRKLPTSEFLHPGSDAKKCFVY